jgi:uncharacterized phage protein (TIGR02220 family)
MNESPLMVIPSLAAKIGLNEAVVLQQMHYWVSISKHVREGKKWIFNTYKDWQEQFPFWSESTIKRTIHSLEKQGCLLSSNWNQKKIDKTKWYTIDYNQIEELESGQSDPSTGQNDPIDSSEWPVDEVNLTQAIPESTSESTTEKDPIVDVIDYLNETTFSSYKPTTRKTKKLIRARLQEGFSVEDFKKVIDLKAADWLNHPDMCNYLRPETLFGNKFESYLNQKSSKKIYREEDYHFDE